MDKVTLKVTRGDYWCRKYASSKKPRRCTLDYRHEGCRCISSVTLVSAQKESQSE